MRIESVRLENFRSFEDATVPFNNYACLVGANGAGKSTVLTALNVLFRESENLPTNLSKLEQEDFHCKNTKTPIRITVTFCNLSEKAQDDFSDYVRQGRLIVTAEASYDEATSTALVKQFGQRLGMTALRPFFEALDGGKRVAELKNIYTQLRETYPDLPTPGTKDAMVAELRSFEAARPEECELIPSEDQFYGFSKGANRLAKHVQWVYVPAVKDATSEQVEARNSALGKLLARTVRSQTNFDESIKHLRAQTQQHYQHLLDGNQHVLDDISSALQSRIAEWAHPEARLRLLWRQDPEKSVRVEEPWAHILAGEGEFEGELARFGHGLQRSYLLALLQELAGTDDDAGPTLILACEEPELYQHPPQARHLAAVLNTLSQGNAQVIVSTHDPLFVSGQGFEDVPYDPQGFRATTLCSFPSVIRRNRASCRRGYGRTADNARRDACEDSSSVATISQRNVFARRLILVEGLEDVAYLWSFLHLIDQEDEFRRLGGHIVATNGKSELLQPLVIARHMRIPTYVIFDADSDKPDKHGSRAKHEKDNRALLAILGKAGEDPLPATTYSDRGFTMWHSDIGAIVEADVGKEKWAAFRAEADKSYGQAGGLRKNSLHIGASLAFAWEDGERPANLARVCASILEPKNYM